MKFSEMYESFDECDETLMIDLRELRVASNFVNGQLMQLRLIGEQTDLQQGLLELEDPQRFLLPLTNCSSSRTLSSGPCLNYTHSCRHKTPGRRHTQRERERERDYF